MDRDLHVIAVFFHAECNKSVRVVSEEPFQLHDLFLGIFVDVFRKAYFLFGILKSHIRRSFRIGPVSEVSL